MGWGRVTPDTGAFPFTRTDYLASMVGAKDFWAENSVPLFATAANAATHYLAAGNDNEAAHFGLAAPPQAPAPVGGAAPPAMPVVGEDLPCSLDVRFAAVAGRGRLLGLQLVARFVLLVDYPLLDSKYHQLSTNHGPGFSVDLALGPAKWDEGASNLWWVDEISHHPR